MNKKIAKTRIANAKTTRKGLVEKPVSNANGEKRNEMLWNWKHYISLNENMSLEHIYQMLKDVDDRLQNNGI